MATLNLDDFKTVFDTDFTKINSLSGTPFNNSWGPAADYWFDGSNGLLLYGQASNNYAPVGFMQAPSGTTAGEGYGLFQFTGSAGIAGEGAGICFVMWRSDNQWLDASSPGTYTELDILESWDGLKTGQATDHYYDAADASDNGQTFHALTNIDLTKTHTFAMDWEPGSLTYYVDGQEVYQITGADVPKDAADGGCNYSMGAEVVNETGPTSLWVKDMSYSTAVAAGTGNATSPATGGGTTAGTTPTGGTTTTPVVTPNTWISVSAPGSVQEATAGAGANETVTITDPGLTQAYAVVMTSANAAEGQWAPVTLNSAGVGVFDAHFEHSGDYVVVVDSPSATVDKGFSSGVTITDPTTPISGGGGSVVTTGTSTAGSGSTGATTGGSTSSGSTSTTPSLPADGSDPTGTGSPTTGSTGAAGGSGITITATSQTAPSFVISGASQSGNNLDIDVTKATGYHQTIREVLDGKYIGTLYDGAPDGKDVLVAGAVTPGSHTLTLTLDGSTQTASMSFVYGSTTGKTSTGGASSTGTTTTTGSSTGSSTTSSTGTISGTGASSTPSTPSTGTSTTTPTPGELFPDSTGTEHGTPGADLFSIAKGTTTLIDDWQSGSDKLVMPAGTNLADLKATAAWNYSSPEGPSWGMQVTDDGTSAFLRYGWQFNASHDVTVAAS